MTEIYFYSGADNKLETVCRLCAKTVHQGVKVLIYSLDSVMIKQLDQLLWTYSPTSFIPHCYINDSVDLIGVTPIILGDRIDQTVHYDVLLNLHDTCPPYFNQFKRLIEIAGVEHEDKLLARKRYRLYQEEGFKIHHFKLDNKEYS
ncbi:MAG: DNA polymerase III subunit chi [Nitrosomonas sp.]|nr:DNA polymerase III subunit chi [Nitrosomonas sp.]